MGPFQLRLLGPPQARRGDHIVRGYRSYKALALLCYLAAEGRPVSRTYLAYLFWGEETEADSRGQLRRALNNLNTLMPDCLEADRRGVQLATPAQIETDVATFDRLAVPGQVEALTAAAELYHGAFMEGFYLDGCPEFEQWLEMTREHWRQRMVGVWQPLIGHYTNLGGYEEALPYAMRWRAQDPLQDASQRQVMLLYARCGRFSLALAQYEAFARLLANELGALPAAETTELYEHLGVAAAMQRLNLPAQPTPFLGRQAELQLIGARLAQAECRLLTLLGPGGIGKTRLAIEAASLHNHLFLHGAHYVALEHVPSPQMLAAAIGDALLLTFTGRHSAATELSSYLRPKELLLILDNIEHLTDGVGLLVELLNQAPGLKLLVTSREQLNLRGEWLFEVDGMRMPAAQGEEDPTTSSAVQLFLQCARRIRPSEPIVAAELPDVARVCRLVGGSPLAIELAATWLPALSCREIAQAIADDLDFLAGSETDRPARHRSLRVVFNHSWSRLSDIEQVTFARLSVFRGGFTHQAARQVTGASAALLSALVRKSLLHHDEAEHFHIHEMLQRFAAGRLAEMTTSVDGIGEAGLTQERHCGYFLNFLAQREEALKGRWQAQALREITEELDNVRAAWAWAIAHNRLYEIVAACGGMYLYYLIKGQSHAGEEVFRLASQMDAWAAAAERWGQTRLRLCWGACALRLGHYQVARELLGQVLAASIDGQAPRERVFALNQLGMVACLQGEYTEANRYLQEALALSQESDDPWEMAAALSYLGNTYFFLGEFSGEYGQARQYYQQALTLYETMGNDWGLGKTLNDLGAVIDHTGDLVAARRIYQKSLDVCQAIGARRGTATALNNLSYLMRLTGAYAEAKRYAEESLLIYREIGDERGVVFALTNLGKAVVLLGECEEARRCFGQALRSGMGLKIYFVMLELLVCLCRLDGVQGRAANPAQLLGFVVRHPACAKETRADALALLDAVTTDAWLPATAGHVEERDAEALEAVVREVLVTLT